MILLSKMKVGLTPPIEYKPATTNETFVLGEALKIASGAMTKASGANAPTHICVGPAKDGNVPCIEVQGFMEFETTLSAAPASGTTLVPGNKVTLSTDGTEVTATTTNGIAEIVRIEGQTIGSVVVVKF